MAARARRATSSSSTTRATAGSACSTTGHTPSPNSLRPDRHATDGGEAAAIWSPPDVELFDDDAVGLLVAMLGEQLGAGAEAVGAGLRAITAHHPHDEPHFYLYVIGAARRGAGLDSVLLRRILDQCDRQGLGAYLESSNSRNVPFYERHGFRVIAEEQIAPDFTCRPMWRDPHPIP